MPSLAADVLVSGHTPIQARCVPQYAANPAPDRIVRREISGRADVHAKRDDAR